MKRAVGRGLLLIGVVWLTLIRPHWAGAESPSCDPRTVSYEDLLSGRCLVISRRDLVAEIRKVAQALSPGLKVNVRACGRIDDDESYVNCVVKAVTQATKRPVTK